jgi:hypothetical protein
LTGQTNARGKRYYRHPAWQPRNGKPFPECGIKAVQRVWVNAEELEEAIFWELFDTFGNPTAVQQAIEDAMPNAEHVKDFRAQQERLRGELANVDDGRARILRLVAKGLVTDAQAEPQLVELRDRGTRLQTELDRLAATPDNLPTPHVVKEFAVKVAGKFCKYVDARRMAKVITANTKPERATWDEKRALVEMVFSGRTAEGKRMGVYVEWIDGQEARRQKAWRYSVHGRLIDVVGTLPAQPPFDPDDPEDGWLGGPLQRLLMDSVSKNALY